MTWKLKHDDNNEFIIIWQSTFIFFTAEIETREQLAFLSVDASGFPKIGDIARPRLLLRGSLHLCLSYEVCLMKFFSHSYLLLYTEDSVVLKSESNNQQRRVVVETCHRVSELPHGWLPSISLNPWSISFYHGLILIESCVPVPVSCTRLLRREII